MGKFLHHSIGPIHLAITGALFVVLLFSAGCLKSRAEYTLILGGDVMLARDGEAIFRSAGESINPWSALQSPGQALDFSSGQPVYFLVNLESPLGFSPQTNGEMNLCATTSEVVVLMDGGVTLATLANNHQNDCQQNGADASRYTLSQNDLLAVEGDTQPEYLAVPQAKIAVLAADDVSIPLDESVFLPAIAEAKRKADLVLVSIHWGQEYQAGPTQRQQQLAQALADAGADVIWGHHPHVLQRMQWFAAADGRKVLVLYSLGNLLSDQWMLEDANRSVLVHLNYSAKTLQAVEIFPFSMDRSSISIYPITNQQQAEKFDQRLQLPELIAQNRAVEVLMH